MRVSQPKNFEAMKLVGDNVKKLRLAKGMTQEGLANASGVDWSTISRLENGNLNTGITVIFALAKAMGVLPSTLLEIP